jgi:hypothetical protein
MLLARDIDTRRQTPMEATELLVDHVQYILAKAQLAGNMVFDGHVPSSEEKRNAEECRLLYDKVERRLQSCKVNEIPALLGCYDFLYMIGYRRMPSGNLADRCKRRMIDAWKRSDKAIEESDVFGLIAFDGAYSAGNTGREYTILYRSIKDRWLDTLSKFDRFPDVTTKENYERLALIMRENIDSRFGADSVKMKRKWYDANKASDLSNFSTTILSTYRRFVSAMYPDVLTHDEQLTLDTLILKELSSRHDVTPYAREAYSIAFALNTIQVDC